MKRLLLVLVSAMCLTALHSQYNRDSLWAIWNDTTNADTIRLDAMMYLSWQEILTYRYDSSMQLINLMYNFAQKQSLDKYEAAFYHTRGYFRHTSGQYEEANQDFFRSIELAEQYGFKQVKAFALMGAADSYYAMNKYDQALEYYERSERFSRQMGFGMIEALAIGNKSTIFSAKGDYSTAEQLLLQAIKLEEKLNLRSFQAAAVNLLGNLYRFQDQLPQAFQMYKRAEQLAEKTDFDVLKAEIFMSIGRLHDRQDEYELGLEYKQKTLDLWRANGAIVGVLWTYNNIGWSHIYMENYEDALENFEMNLILSDSSGNDLGASSAYLGFGEVYHQIGDHKKALENNLQSYELRKGMNSERRIAYSSFVVGRSYQALGQNRTALPWCERAYRYYELNQEIEDYIGTCQCLYRIHKALGQPATALYFHEQMLALKDTINNRDISKQMQKLEFDKQLLADSLADQEEAYRVEMAHEAEINRKNRVRDILMGSGLLVFLLAGGLWNRLIYTRKSRATISKERDRSENLLLNILPYKVAEELKTNGKAAAQHFNNVSILFTDFKDFTKISEKLSPEALVTELNILFEAFDRITEKYGIEKIKTIGDAYMAAGGIPVPDDAAPGNTVLAALEMQAFVGQRVEKVDPENTGFKMRVGIHTGPVVAGIVGVKKFQYDLWGDTVNTASRMENNCETGKVNISQSTFDLIRTDSHFEFEERNPIAVKGKGVMNMYYVRKSDLIN